MLEVTGAWRAVLAHGREFESPLFRTEALRNANRAHSATWRASLERGGHGLDSRWQILNFGKGGFGYFGGSGTPCGSFLVSFNT